MAKNKFNKSWINQHLNDPYVKLAQKEGFRSRAAFKLKEIDETSHLIKSGQVVVELGSTPGSWTQYVVKKMGREQGKIKGDVVGLDLLAMEPIEGVHFILGDFTQESVLVALEEHLGDKKADLILSDMAPNLSGIALTDAANMEYLMDLTLDFAQNHLKPEGAMLVKCFNGLGYNEILGKFRKQFKKVVSKKPKASRNQSSEIYLLAEGLK